ncbi:enoyl-CoA hydratase 2, peroxisomal isoform X2 [Cryptomeria japonica]|uniref:enoyl-CoA hydratase 2, peroxisomal isoform X2 n=1 Tax=Cryptomeria japonica TaxID=3369 RepID=UPI0025AC2D96|nr:enoyl-CoA hydratase 2, peroxisomal isoform X2 [Cryptomeria japonica]
MTSSIPTIEPELVLAHKFPESFFDYTERDVALYALGVGACGANAVDEEELKYVYHQYGQSYIQIQNRAHIAGLHDKGKATILEIESTSINKETGEVLCRNRNTVYLRGTGGFSKTSDLYSYSSPSLMPKVTPVVIPKGTPFAVYEDKTQQSQALLYRLSGDYNPLHSDPMVANIAGFSRPILHGLCTLGYAVRAIIKCCCNGKPALVKSVLGRFILHVYPGETLITEMWKTDSRIIYQTRVKERQKVVLSGAVVVNHLSSSL